VTFPDLRAPVLEMRRVSISVSSVWLPLAALPVFDTAVAHQYNATSERAMRLLKFRVSWDTYRIGHIVSLPFLFHWGRHSCSSIFTSHVGGERWLVNVGVRRGVSQSSVVGSRSCVLMICFCLQQQKKRLAPMEQCAPPTWICRTAENVFDWTRSIQEPAGRQ
jgi:hypothetical protein